MPDAVKLPKEPCPSCPYRKDTPSGIWAASHYESLPTYDKPTWAQPIGAFMCHQQNGCACGGWLTTHDPSQLLAVRLEVSQGTMPEAVFDYPKTHDVECYASGEEACDAGMAEILEPGPEAAALIKKMARQQTPLRRQLVDPFHDR